MTRILIARHGNTFAKGETPLRVGARTDMPLSDSGRAQAQCLGEYLATQYDEIAATFCSELQRTQKTAKIALSTANMSSPIHIDTRFNEIDYGPDEAKTEAAVIARIGKAAIQAWDAAAVPPPGWLVNPQDVIKSWKNFATEVLQTQADKTILVVTSNGIARFAPHLTADFQAFQKQYPIKMSTGAISSLVYQQRWLVEYWNYCPGRSS